MPAMRTQNSGAIVNIASVVAVAGPPGYLHYVATKGAVLSMTKGLAKECGPHDVRVKVIAPGFVITDAAKTPSPPSPRRCAPRSASCAWQLVEIAGVPPRPQASTITIITRKVTASALFHETPVGLRRRRSMVEGMPWIDAQAAAIGRSGTPLLDAIAAVRLYDYQQLRFGDQARLPSTQALRALAQAWRSRPSFHDTMPFVA